MVGRARDIVTPIRGGAPVILAEDGFEAWLQPDRTIVSIEADPGDRRCRALSAAEAAGVCARHWRPRSPRSAVEPHRYI